MQRQPDIDMVWKFFIQIIRYPQLKNPWIVYSLQIVTYCLDMPINYEDIY